MMHSSRLVGNSEDDGGTLGATHAQRNPKATIAVLLITGIVTVFEFRFPVLIVALERTPGMLASGQWWRLITSILINPEGWSQIVFNLSGIAIVGFLVERMFGSARWLILYLTGALVGELAGRVWKPAGAGSSVAICGLLGGLAAWLLWRRQPIQSRFGGASILLGALVLTGMRDLHGPPLLAGAFAALVMLSRDALCASGA
jgi:rhomboid protease GluP